MVVSISKATSTDYYTASDGVGESAESYYLDAVAEGEPPAQWSGSGAERLGLEGEVIADDMTTVYSERINPRTGEQIGRRPDKHRSVEERLAAKLAAEPDALPERVAEIRAQVERTDRRSPIGWDATFSVAKSVTVAHTAAHRAELAAVRAGDVDRAEQFHTVRMGIETAIKQANSAMLAYAETLATTRTGGSAGAPTEWVAAPGLVVASFFQHTNRNIDPQLHIHNVILGYAFSADGKARALDGQDLLANKHALGAIADRVLEEAMTAMGFEVQLRPDGKARELTIVSPLVADLFSSRSRQMSSKVADLLTAAQERTGRELTDLELYYLKQQATLSTRAAKSSHVHETAEEMLDRWEAMTIGAVGSGLDSVADQVLAHLAATADTAGGAVEWSPSAIIAEAVAACGEQRSAWRRSDLILEVARRLPSLGGLDPKTTIEVLERLTDQAMTGPLVRQVSGHPTNPDAPADTTTAAAQTSGAAGVLQNDSMTRPTARLYATVNTLTAEEALRRAGIERGGHHLKAADMSAWLDEHTPSIGADQRAAVLGIATTDARLCVLVGPAGTGKSYAAGAFANAWAQLTAEQSEPGRVIGLAVSQIATEVLRDDGVEHARNISQWLDLQDKIANGSTHPATAVWALQATDVVMVDEASMVATADLHRIHELVQDAGARMVLTGDPRQLGAVEAGGVMGLLDGHAETYTLADVRRFATAWEPAASLALRDGDPEALSVYDRHGRLLAHDTTEEATQAAATAAVADRVDGRSVVVVTGSNEQAAAIATSVRNQLVDLGLVQADGVLLGLDGCTAGIGDLVTARRNDYGLGIMNRGQYQVTAIGEDGSLTVVPTDRDSPTSGGAAEPTVGRPVVLPATYVGEHVQLGYASTAHAAQGLTVDAAHLVTDGTLDAPALYVGMSRGRLRNTAHVGLNAPAVKDTRPAAATDKGGEIRLEQENAKPSARAVLEGCLERQNTNRAATVEAELDAERLSSMNLLAGRYEAVVRAACRERLDRHLDELTADGVLPADVRVRLGADQGTEHLSRLLRAVEQTGRDPRQVLIEAINDPRGFDVDSVAQVLSHRITGGHPLPHPISTETGHDVVARIPAEVGGPAAEHLTHLATRIDTRRVVLGERVAADPPPWALDAFGPVPTIPDQQHADADERLVEQEDVEAATVRKAHWVERAGIVEAHREATGWDDPHRPLGPMPGLAATERRASYTASWDVLGRPEAGLDEAAMTEGQLRVRVRAMEAELDWAPPHADHALRTAETSHEQARQTAALARAQADQAQQAGDLDAVEQWQTEAATAEQTAAMKAAAIQALTVAADGRAAWAGTAAPTIDTGTRSRAELERRGIRLDAESDRTSTEDWLHAEREHRQAEDAHRPITETDLHDPVAHEIDHGAADIDEEINADVPALDTDATATDGISDDAEKTGLQIGHNDASDDTEAADPQVPVLPRARSRAHEVLPEDVSTAELEAATAITALALNRIGDRASQEATHTREADRDAPAAELGESAEIGRRRREAADLDRSASAAQVNAPTLDVSMGDV